MRGGRKRKWPASSAVSPGGVFLPAQREGEKKKFCDDNDDDDRRQIVYLLSSLHLPPLLRFPFSTPPREGAEMMMKRRGALKTKKRRETEKG